MENGKLVLIVVVAWVVFVGLPFLLFSFRKRSPNWMESETRKRLLERLDIQRELQRLGVFRPEGYDLPPQPVELPQGELFERKPGETFQHLIGNKQLSYWGPRKEEK